MKTFKQRFTRLFLGFIALFILLFLFRLAYGYTKTTNTIKKELLNSLISTANDFSLNEDGDGISLPYVQNFASKKYKVKSASNNQIVSVDQKYEKIANIKTKSADFEQEEKLTKEKIATYEALIQFEQKRGNKGSRKLDLIIGVPPHNFDALYNELIKIGRVEEKQITKTDKTNEYKELNAKKQSLEKIRTSLIDLKSKGGKISEYIELENRILEIERQLQELGVSLGDFDNENEFCTVKFALLEGKEHTIDILQRIKVALEWTVKIYLKIMTSLFFLSLFVYLVLLFVDKIKLLEKLLKK